MPNTCHQFHDIRLDLCDTRVSLTISPAAAISFPALKRC